MLLGGGLNLYQRFVTGCVRDDFFLWFFHANIADILITVGLFIVVFVFIIKSEEV